MAKAEFLLLAHVFNPKKHLASGAFMSEKLDGFRVCWDGGVTRGMLKQEVPWANTVKDHIRKEEQISTGLWTRYGNIVHAPDFWIDRLPEFMLDGELWMGRGLWQTTRSIGSKFPENRIDSDWEKLNYKVFDIPTPEAFALEREIKDADRFRKIIGPGALTLVKSKLKIEPRAKSFQNVLLYLKRNIVECSTLQVLEQEQLPFSTDAALKRIAERSAEIYELGGEGLMCRRPQSIWVAERSHDIFKIKPYEDSEATVIGYVTGRQTEKGSKLRGLMGALVVKWNAGVVFELSGFTDDERVLQMGNLSERKHITECRDFIEISDKDMMVEPRAFAWAWENPSPPNGPGTRVDETTIHNPKFPIGSKVTFKYREMSDEGVPKEAAYLRQPMLQ